MFTHSRITDNLNLVHFRNSTQVYSYETLVAFVTDSFIYVDSNNYSRTTNKHIGIIKRNKTRKSKTEITVTNSQLQQAVQEYIHDSYRQSYLPESS